MILVRGIHLYMYLMRCNESPLDKVILDCGAGGELPPLALFKQFGYETHGIEIDEEQLQKANRFASENKLELSIIKGDMRKLPFEDEKFSFVYSINTIFHMNKEDIRKTLEEMKRVLKPGGLLFVNFMGIEDVYYGEGKEIGKGEFLVEKEERDTIRSFHEDNEADYYFSDSEIIIKDKWQVQSPAMMGDKKAVLLGYIIKKS